MTPCPDENALAAFVDGSADAKLKTTIEAHLDRCAACTDLLAALALTQRGSSGESLRREPAASRAKARVASSASSSSPAAPLTSAQLDVVVGVCGLVHLSSLAWLAPSAGAYLSERARLSAAGWVQALVLSELSVCLVAACLTLVAMVLRVLKRPSPPLPVLTLAIFSWLHPALWLLSTWISTKLGEFERAQRLALITWLIWVSVPAFALGSSLLIWLLAAPTLLTAAPLASVWLGLLVAGLVTAVATGLASHRSRPRWAKAFVLFALPSVVATPLGLGVLLLLPRQRVSP